MAARSWARPPEVAAATLDALGADVLGINCSLGPQELRPFVQRMLATTSKPVMVQANAGLPHVENGETVFDIAPDAYAQAVAPMVEDGVSVIGGCCGTTPEHIRLLAPLMESHQPSPRATQPAFTVCSAQTAVSLPMHTQRIAVVGERINPTGKKRLQQALRANDIDLCGGPRHCPARARCQCT